MKPVRAIRVFLSVLAFALSPAPAFAVPSMTVVQPLSFGRFLIRYNTSVQTVTVTPAGSASYSGGIMSIDAANRGTFQLLGFDPDMDLIITVDPSPLTVSCVCAGPSFSVTGFTLSPAIPHTDPSGNAAFNLGATLNTSGDSATYDAGPYSGTITITVNY